MKTLSVYFLLFIACFTNIYAQATNLSTFKDSLRINNYEAWETSDTVLRNLVKNWLDSSDIQRPQEKTLQELGFYVSNNQLIKPIHLTAKSLGNFLIIQNGKPYYVLVGQKDKNSKSFEILSRRNMGIHAQLDSLLHEKQLKATQTLDVAFDFSDNHLPRLVLHRNGDFGYVYSKKLGLPFSMKNKQLFQQLIKTVKDKDFIKIGVRLANTDGRTEEFVFFFNRTSDLEKFLKRKKE